jgi:2-polyprenyl-3-methyl-5-hydroxy-6-metoxy-1,4-benzoquinol methylase
MARTFLPPRPLLPTPPHHDAPEILDAPGAVPADALAHNLRDIRRVNRFAGGTAVVLRHLPVLLADVPRETPITLLDLATGSADIPLALARWGTERGYDFRIVATDVSDDVLAVAREITARTPQITVEVCDARALPYRDGAFDIALCSLALHHFPRDEAIVVLREMERVSRRGIIVNDLVRSWPGFVGAWLLGNATTRNRLTRHDAPLSILRAWTPDELRTMAKEAGLHQASVTTHAFWRMALVARRQE